MHKGREQNSYWWLGISAILVLVIASSWLFRLELLPGLHGDEAYFGMQAGDFLSAGVDRIYGLNSYTGVLFSSLVSLSFKLFGMSVQSLRMTGTLLNIAALALSVVFWLKAKNVKGLTFFLLLICQSALYMLYPRIAWEVTALLFFFLVLYGLCVYQVLQKPVLPMGYVIIALATGIIGTYNHIIFMCVPISLSLTMILRTFFNHEAVRMRLIPFWLLNALNPILMFLFMKYVANSVWHSMGLWCLTILVFVIVLEYWVLLKWRISHLIAGSKARQHYIIFPFALFALFYFCWHHLIALWQVGSNAVIFMRLFSSTLPFGVQLLFLIGGTVSTGFLLFLVCKDVFFNKANSPSSIPALGVIFFLGIFTLLTGRNAIRYYLLVVLVCNAFLAWRASSIKITSIMGVGLWAMLLVTASVNVICIIGFLRPANEEVQARHFRFGPRYKETSAHFISTLPLIAQLRKDSVAVIQVPGEENYFIMQPLSFYKRIAPWEEVPGRTATVSYNYKRLGSGFEVEVLNDSAQYYVSH